MRFDLFQKVPTDMFLLPEDVVLCIGDHMTDPVPLN